MTKVIPRECCFYQPFEETNRDRAIKTASCNGCQFRLFFMSSIWIRSSRGRVAMWYMCGGGVCVRVDARVLPTLTHFVPGFWDSCATWTHTFDARLFALGWPRCAHDTLPASCPASKGSPWLVNPSSYRLGQSIRGRMEQPLSGCCLSERTRADTQQWRMCLWLALGYGIDSVQLAKGKLDMPARS